MKGTGTDEYCLTASILLFQGIMGSGYPAFEKEYGKSLEKRVKGEVKGDYEKLLVEMINANVKMDYEEEAWNVWFCLYEECCKDYYKF